MRHRKLYDLMSEISSQRNTSLKPFAPQNIHCIVKKSARHMFWFRWFWKLQIIFFKICNWFCLALNMAKFTNFYVRMLCSPHRWKWAFHGISRTYIMHVVSSSLACLLLTDLNEKLIFHLFRFYSRCFNIYAAYVQWINILPNRI